MAANRGPANLPARRVVRAFGRALIAAAALVAFAACTTRIVSIEPSPTSSAEAPATTRAADTPVAPTATFLPAEPPQPTLAPSSNPSPTAPPTPVDARAAPAALPATATPTPTPEPTPTPRPRPFVGPLPAGRIAFASPDSQIYTISPDGADLARISPERPPPSIADSVPGYTWPVWSPDASRLLFSAALPTGVPSQPQYLLLSSSSDGSTSEDPIVVFRNVPGSTLVGPGTPHYSIWSPDGEQVAMIVGTDEGLAVMVADPAQTGEGIEVVPGAPVYLSWSSNSTHLLVHVRDRLLRFDSPFYGPPLVLEGGINAYQAPSFAPMDGRSAFLVASDTEITLNVLDSEAAAMTAISRVPDAAAFSWAPDGSSLAVLKSAPDGSGIYEQLAIVVADGSSEYVAAEGNFVSFEWAPDGKRILLAEPVSGVQNFLRWSVLDVESGAVEHLADFLPTGELGFFHVYFDQFAASHTLWSPDSRWVVLAGALLEPEPDELDASRGQDTVWVIDTEREAPPIAIADGFLAFWSPR